MRFFQHSSALVESRRIGKGTRVWAFSHVQKKATIGSDCNIGENCFIENGARIGDRVTIKNGVCVWKGITVEDEVFIGPNVALTNDRHPRSPRAAVVRNRYKDERWLVRSRLGRGCTLGANATIVGPVRLGKYCFVGAGAVVIRDVRDFELVAGNPARHVGWVDRAGKRVKQAPRR